MPQPLQGLAPRARRSRWFARASPVDDRLFQGSDDPYPGHWRQNPAPWPPGFTGDESARRQLRGWRAGLDRHLAGCDGCTTYLQQVRAIVDALAGLDSDQRRPQPAAGTAASQDA
jgi:hypothetical protein